MIKKYAGNFYLHQLTNSDDLLLIHRSYDSVIEYYALSKIHLGMHFHARFVIAVWFLQKVEITDLKNNVTTVFPCNQLLDKKKVIKKYVGDLCLHQVNEFK